MKVIYKVLTGSRGYGTHHDESDFDYRSVCVMPKDYYLGLKKMEQTNEYGEEDSVIYNIDKFLTLCMSSNPNIIEMLFVEDPISVDHVFEEVVLKNRDMFLTKKVMKTYCGYAFQQLKKTKNHKKWIDSPIAEPKRDEYDVPKCPVFTLDDLKQLTGVRTPFLAEEMRQPLKKELQYRADFKEYQKYKNWVDNRNPERHKLEAKFGYDAKNAMHLIRLLRTGIEILKGEGLKVKRPDAEELKEIRNGSLSYDELIKYTESLDKEIKRCYDSSKLPETVDFNKVNDIKIELLERYLYETDM